MIPEPSGCAWCGLPESHHMQRWHAVGGWHHWTPPTQPQRLARMRARRTARTTEEPPVD